MPDQIYNKVVETEQDYYQKVTDAEKDFADLFNRMDEDKKLLTLEDFVWKDKDDREEPDVDNITLNDASTFANRVHNNLIKAQINPEVEGNKLKDKDTEVIEAFIKDIEVEADSHAFHQDIPAFKNFEIMQACDRGRIARRVTLREENGKLTPDSFQAIDTRYLVYRYNVDGLDFVASKMPRTADDVAAEYGEEKRPASKNVIITDFWDSEMERVYCGRELIDEAENIWGEPPFIIQVVPTGIFTFDADRFLYSGESIFSMNRALYKEKNLFGTILKSLTIKSFFNGLQLEVENVALARKPIQPPYGKKFVAPIQKGTQGYFNMPIADLQNAARMFYSILDVSLQDGAIPKTSYGTTQFPLSGTAISQLKEAEDPVYLPRIQGYTMFLQRLYQMVIKQYVMFKMHATLGEPGFTTQYNWKDLNKEVSLKFQVDLRSPKQDMVNISTAAAVGNLVSDDTKRRDYLHLQNPDEELTKVLVEKAGRLSPLIERYDVIKALFERGEKTKANLMAGEMGMSLEALMSGQAPQAIPTGKPAEEQQPKQLIPMFGGNGGGGRPATTEPMEDQGGYV